MNALIEETLKQVPGLVLGISIVGKRTLSAHGARQVFGVDRALPMTVDTSFDAASITKVIATTASLMRLVDANAISLEERASKFLSSWSDTEKEEITLRDLLLHRSGLWEWRPLYITFQESSKIAEKISSIPLRYAINEDRHYSDLGFISLGQVVTSITGEDLPASVKRLVLQPLGMESTRYTTPYPGRPICATSLGDAIEKEMVLSKVPFPVPEEAAQFDGWRSRVLVGEVNDGNAFHLFDGHSGHAGLFTTAEDLLTFGESMNASMNASNSLSEREFGSFSRSVSEEFLTAGPDKGQQLGFRSWSDTYDGCTCEFFGHTGFTGAVFAFSPVHDCVLTLLTNRLHCEGEKPSTELLWQPFLSAIHRKIHA